MKGSYLATIEVKTGQIRPRWRLLFREMCTKAGLNPDTEEARVISEFVPKTIEFLVITKKK